MPAATAQQQVTVFHNTFREKEGRSDKRWWTVIVKRDDGYVQHKHFDGQMIDGVDEAEQRATEYAGSLS